MCRATASGLKVGGRIILVLRESAVEGCAIVGDRFCIISSMALCCRRETPSPKDKTEEEPQTQLSAKGLAPLATNGQTQDGHGILDRRPEHVTWYLKQSKMRRFKNRGERMSAK